MQNENEWSCMYLNKTLFKEVKQGKDQISFAYQCLNRYSSQNFSLTSTLSLDLNLDITCLCSIACVSNTLFPLLHFISVMYLIACYPISLQTALE